MTRSEHLSWCKKRALELLDAGQLENAFASMCSDLRKHTETENHFGIKLGMMMMGGGRLSTFNEMRVFIEGFN